MDGKINLETMSIDECKALAYDLITERDKVQRDINVLTNVIAKKSQEKQLKTI